MQEFVTEFAVYIGIAAAGVTVLGFLLSLWRRGKKGDKPVQPPNVLKSRISSLFNIASPIQIFQGPAPGGELTPETLNAINEAVEKEFKTREIAEKNATEVPLPHAELQAQLEKSQEIIKELRADLERNAQEEPLFASAREKIDAGEFPGADGDLEQAYRSGLDALEAGQQRAARAAFERGRLADAQL